MLTKKNGLALLVKGLEKIDWIICRLYKVCGRKDFILGIYNTWREIIHIIENTCSIFK